MWSLYLRTSGKIIFIETRFALGYNKIAVWVYSRKYAATLTAEMSSLPLILETSSRTEGSLIAACKENHREA